MKLMAAALLVLAPPCAQADIFDAAAIGLAAGDVVTTHVAKQRGFVETNIDPTWPRIGANVFLTGAVLFAAHTLEKDGHPGYAKAVKIGLCLTWGTVVALNIRTMQRGLNP